MEKIKENRLNWNKKLFNFMKINFRPFIIFAFLWIGLSSCKNNNSSNIYAELSNGNIGWQEVGEQLADGSSAPGNLRKYFFFRDGTYQLVCEASDASCLVSNNNFGTWDYITSTKVQVTINNGPILFYDIVQLDGSHLWFQDNNTKNQKILRQLIPAK